MYLDNHHFWFYTFSFSESSDDPIPYEAKATSKVQVVNFCLSLFFLGNQIEMGFQGNRDKNPSS